MSNDFFDKFEEKTRELVNAVLSIYSMNMGDVTEVNAEQWEAMEEMAVNIELNLIDYDKGE